MRFWSGSSFKSRVIDVMVILALCGSVWAVFVGLVFAPVPRRPQMTYCATNLYNIATALKIYHQDHGAYPVTLADTVQRVKGKVVPFEETRGDALFPDYTKGGSGSSTFHCPLSPIKNTSALVTVPVGNRTREYYAWDSYDAYTPSADSDRGELRYRGISAKDASDNPVVTWCDYHAVGSTDKIPVLFLNAQVSMKSASSVAASKWSTQPDR